MPSSAGRQDGHTERTPLLRRTSSYQSSRTATSDPDVQTVGFSKEDSEDPRQWSYSRKMTNVFVIALMAVLSPLASSMFTPAISKIADSLHVPEDQVVGATTGFVVMLGIGPLILAPLSETFGRRTLYLVCFSCFSLLQIPTALSPNVETLIAVRTLSGFFGSVGIANGGGSLSDMFAPSERAGVYGWYLLGPLLGPSLGPLFGGVIAQHLEWRWIFWVLTIVCSFNTILGFIFLKETFAPVLLEKRCAQLAREHGGTYTFEGQDTSPILSKLAKSLKRPLLILFTQPIVLTMATYQAVIFVVVYSLFTNMESMFSGTPYNFNTMQVGFLYLGTGLGFMLAVFFIVPRIDTVYNAMTRKNDGVAKPEFRLPLANIGAVLLPIALFWFAWTVQRTHWLVPIASTVLLGLGQIAIFNTVQNYYIDAFEKYAASAVAAGAVFRSFVGGIVPLFTPQLFRSLGYAWGWSVLAFLTILLAPTPLLFMRYGERIREKFAIEL